MTGCAAAPPEYRGCPVIEEPVADSDRIEPAVDDDVRSRELAGLMSMLAVTCSFDAAPPSNT